MKAEGRGRERSGAERGGGALHRPSRPIGLRASDKLRWIYIHVYMHVYPYECACVYTCICMSIHLYVLMFICISIHMSTHTSMHISMPHLHTHVYMHVCTHIYTHVYVHAYGHTYTHVDTHAFRNRPSAGQPTADRSFKKSVMRSHDEDVLIPKAMQVPASLAVSYI